MKKLKKAVSVLLMVVMVLSMTCTGFANTTYSDTSGSITINNDVSGYTYVAYQIFDGDLINGKLSNIVWGSAIATTDHSSALAAVQAITVNSDEPFKDCTSAADVADVLDACSDDDAIVQAFADAIGEYASSNGVTLSQKSDKSGYYTDITDVGYYLVKTSVVPDGYTHTRYIMLVVGAAEANTKSSKTTLDKTVDDIDDSTGDKESDETADYDLYDDVPFTLTATLPTNYSEYDTYKLVFHDTLSSSLSFNENVVVTVYSDSTDTTGTVVYSGYSVEIPGDNGETFKVVINDTNALYESGSTTAISVTKDSIIVVTYTAQLIATTSNAADAATNTAKLEYSDDPNSSGSGSTGNTPDDVTTVFTFNLYVEKTDGTDALAGAAFTLYKYAPNDSNADANGFIEVKALDAGTETEFCFDGLDAGQYKIVETTTPAGYNSIEDIYFVIEANHYENASGEAVVELSATETDSSWGKKTGSDAQTITVKNGTELDLETTIVNKAGATLPSTGGIGTTIFYVVGGILVVAAAVLLITKGRMKRSE
ncbi:MAG: isopeptide-forming domain-containing fimbrial protein [Clostridiales bacterium]|nr:isopeptide-forming domain-containing fimbrial protein [Clostridiales bacterium]